MNFGAQRDCTLIVGASGTGKTTFALRYLVNVPFVCRFVFDYDGQAARRLKLPGCTSIPACEDALASGWVLYDPNVEFPGRHPEAFSSWCGWVFEVCSRGPGRKILLVDEVWRYCNNWQLPQELASCIQTGRVRELSLCFVTQRPNRLNEAIIGECTELVAFRIQGANALRVVQDLGIPGDQVEALNPGEYIARCPGSRSEARGKLWESARVPFPARGGV